MAGLAALAARVDGHADAVVFDHDLVPGPLAFQGEARTPGIRVLADVGEGFLHDVEDLDLAPDGKVELADVVGEFERDAGAVEEGLGHLLQRVEQALRIHPAAKIGDELAQPPVRIGERGVDVVPVLECPRVVAVANRVAQQAHPHAHVRETLRQRIVHLVRHHLALVGEGRAQGLALDAREFGRRSGTGSGGIAGRRAEPVIRGRRWRWAADADQPPRPLRFSAGSPVAAPPDLLNGLHAGAWLPGSLPRRSPRRGQEIISPARTTRKRRRPYPNGVSPFPHPGNGHTMASLG